MLFAYFTWILKNINKCFLCFPGPQYFKKMHVLMLKDIAMKKDFWTPSGGEASATFMFLKYWATSFCNPRHSQTKTETKNYLLSSVS